jgi:hypothetical protein
MHTDASAYGFLLFIGAGLGAALGALVLLGALVARKWTLALTLLGVAAVAAAGYAALLAGVSWTSRDVVLGPGVEKHLCEIDCHLAYAVTGVRTAPALGTGAGALSARGTFWIVTVQARFDETTMGPRRPLDAPVYGGPRTVVIVDEQGRRFAPSHAARPARQGAGGECLAEGHPLLPGATCTATLVFDLPGDARRPRLLVATAAPEAALTIGHEMSLGHRRSYFELDPQSGTAVRR